MTLGLEVLELDQIFDTVSCIQLLCHTILIYAGSELRQFGAFSAWLRQEIEMQATDPTSVTAEEPADKDVMLDYLLILEYIQGSMQNSKLYELLNIQRPSDERPQWQMPEDQTTLYESYRTEIQKIRQDQRPDRKLPGLDSLLQRLDRQCKIVFQRLAAAQGRKVRLGSLIQFEEGVAHHDMRMIAQVSGRKHGIWIWYSNFVRPTATNTMNYRYLLCRQAQDPQTSVCTLLLSR